MRTIEVKVMDDLVIYFGIEAIKKFLEEELEYQRFRLLENRIQIVLSDTDVPTSRRPDVPTSRRPDVPTSRRPDVPTSSGRKI
ncbi:MAG: hypothetical protein QG657_1640 [Acidobacteriota bacterium]|nr:hypothetical protein [Acidobacteriota bacterium]